jgi:hypothetical protein
MNAKRVFFIGIDGVGNYIKEANTPNIDKILYGGSYSYEAATVVPTISGECWGSLFHGVGPIDHLLTNDIVSNNKFDLSLPYPSFIKKIREAHPEKDVSSFVVWNPINTGILEEDIHMVKEKAADDKVAGLMINRIREKKEDIVYSQVVLIW